MSLGEIISALLENLPVGFGFRPTDEELVGHYLKLKIQGNASHVDIIPVVDVCNMEPWQLPDLSVIRTSDPDWFFFNPVDYKYSNGSHFNRQTKLGYWKPTGQDREIKSGTNIIGTKKTLVFYKGRGRAAVRTSWVIHEYRSDIASPPTHKAYVLCHLMKKKDDNTGSDGPAPEEALAGVFSPGISFNGSVYTMPLTGSQNGIASNMPFGVQLSFPASNIISDIRNYQEEEMLLDEDPELQGLLCETAVPLLDHDMFPNTQRGYDADFSSPSGFNNGYDSMQLQDEHGADFADSLLIDSDGYLCERSLAVNRLSACPQSPLRGAYNGKGARPSSGTDTEVVHVKDSALQQASSPGVSGSKHSLQSSIAQQQQPRRENFVVQRVGTKSVKLEDHETLQAKLAKLSCSIIKLEEHSVPIKAKDKAESGSATHQHNNSTKESKKETEVPQKENPKLSSVTRCNEMVSGGDQNGSQKSLKVPSVNHESSCSQAQLVNLVVGMIMLVSLIIVMMLDMGAKF